MGRLGGNMKELRGKRVAETAVRDQVSVVFPEDLNTNGTLFGGRVLEMADKLCAIVAKRHTGKSCVTLGIDSVRFLAPAFGGDILVFQASINHVWHTSMEVGVRVSAENHRTGKQERIFSAYFTFVAVDEQMKPLAVVPVIPETADEKRRYEEADQRRKRRVQT